MNQKLKRDILKNMKLGGVAVAITVGLIGFVIGLYVLLLFLSQFGTLVLFVGTGVSFTVVLAVASVVAALMENNTSIAQFVKDLRTKN